MSRLPEGPPGPARKARRGSCPSCGKRLRVRRDGSVGSHPPADPVVTGRWAECPGSGRTAVEHASAGRLGEPRRIVVAGDWHGNNSWAISAINQAAKVLAGESVRLILHLGDFGIWPGDAGAEYRDSVSWALLAHGIRLWFVDGNHEDFTQLEQYRITDGCVPLSWLPRGYRWTWHGRTWVAVGGGVSLDRKIRTEGRDWWPQEEISDGQEAAIIAGGRGDVMASHDRPSGVIHTFPDRPEWWDQRDIDRSERHEERLQRIVDAVRPQHLMHGHLHRAYSRTVDFGYGPVSVTGLAADKQAGNCAVLNVQTMEWDTGRGT